MSKEWGWRNIENVVKRKATDDNVWKKLSLKVHPFELLNRLRRCRGLRDNIQCSFMSLFFQPINENCD